MAQGQRFDLDPQVASLPLRKVLVFETEEQFCCSGHQVDHLGCGINALAISLAERWGVSSRTAHRWMRDVHNLETISIYVADEIACALGIPFASLYPGDAA